MQANDLIAYVDVDDTLVRSVGSKRIPMTAVVEHVRQLHAAGVTLHCWSAGGAMYARSAARELGIEALFTSFLAKPHLLIDDQPPSEWPHCVVARPAGLASMSVQDHLQALAHSGRGASAGDCGSTAASSVDRRAQGSDLYQRARLLYDQGTFAEAAPAFEASARAAPHFKSFELLGECLLELGRAPEAVLPLAAACALNHGARARVLLARALQAIGEVREARAWLAEALVRHPGYGPAEAALRALPE